MNQRRDPELGPAEGRPRCARRLALLLGAASFLGVVATLSGPGITSDEPLDVRVGRRYVEALGKALEGRFSPFDRRDVERLFADNAQHPPLGRWLVGIASTLLEPLEGALGGPDPFSVHAARVAPAVAFGCLVGWIALAVAQRHGPWSGVTASLALVQMPRVFAHAHLATLDTVLAFFWVGTVLAVARSTERRRPLLATALAGVIWGLALLTKIHAWLLPPVALVWFLVRLGWRRGLLAFVLWSSVGLLILFVGWPWLWFDPIDHLTQFLATSTDRLALRVRYFGTVYLDKDVPWHYPWFYFAATVPIGLHALGAVGLVEAWRHRRDDAVPFLLIGAMLLLMVVFSTGAPVYDGARLFLPVFPLWAILIGIGARPVIAWAHARARKIVLLVFLIAQSVGLISTSPFGLSYYNALVGGLPGAERLDLELTYWGDTIDPVLLDELARRAQLGQSVALAPTLHHIQPAAYLTSSLFDKGITIRPEGEPADWLIVYRRSAYWSPTTRARVESRPPLFARTRQGVWLSGIWPIRD